MLLHLMTLRFVSFTKRGVTFGKSKRAVPQRLMSSVSHYFSYIKQVFVATKKKLLDLVEYFQKTYLQNPKPKVEGMKPRVVPKPNKKKEPKRTKVLFLKLYWKEVLQFFK